MSIKRVSRVLEFSVCSLELSVESALDRSSIGFSHARKISHLKRKRRAKRVGSVSLCLSRCRGVFVCVAKLSDDDETLDLEKSHSDFEGKNTSRAGQSLIRNSRGTDFFHDAIDAARTRKDLFWPFRDEKFPSLECPLEFENNSKVSELCARLSLSLSRYYYYSVP